MIVLTLGEKDWDFWDGYVSAQDCGHFMQSRAWGDFRQSQGWGIEYLVAMDGDKPVAAMMLQIKKLPLPGAKIALSPRGPVFDAARPEALDPLLTAARRIKGLALLRCDPYFTSRDPRCEAMRRSGCRALSRSWSHWNNPRNVMILDISGGPEAYFRAMPTAFRTKIRKPEKHGVLFRSGTGNDLAHFCGLMRETARNKNIAMHNAAYYAALYEHLAPAGMLALFVAEYEGKPISVGMSIKYGAKAWLIYAASDPAHFRLGANRTLQMRMIEWAMAAGCRVYDFRGSATNYPPRQSDPGYGVYEFKKSFGAELTVLSPYQDFYPSPLGRVLPALLDGLAVPALYAASRLRTKSSSWLNARGKDPA